MTDQLNEAGLDAAVNKIAPSLGELTEWSHKRIARAAITVYLECVGANAGPYSDAKLLEGRDRFIINKGLWGEFVKQVEGLTAAPTPETREPSAEAPVKDSLTPSNHPEIPESWMLAEINRLREALQGIVDCAMSGSLFEELALDALENRGIDHQSALPAAPKAPSAEGNAMSERNEEYIAAAKRLAMQARTLTDDLASPYFEWCQEQIEADIYAALAVAHRAGKLEGEGDE